MAGMAKVFCWQYSNSFKTSSPVMTPDLRERTSWAPIVMYVCLEKSLANENWLLFIWKKRYVFLRRRGKTAAGRAVLYMLRKKEAKDPANRQNSDFGGVKVRPQKKGENSTATPANLLCSTDAVCLFNNGNIQLIWLSRGKIRID